MKPFREPGLVKPVIKVAIEVADEHIEHRQDRTDSPYDVIDVITRLRGAICLAEDAGLSTLPLTEMELMVRLHG